MKSVIRQWNPDAGTYGEVLLTLWAPDEPQGDRILMETCLEVVKLAKEPIAVFFDDETVPTWTNGVAKRRHAACRYQTQVQTP